jgi:glycosyltransferase involved in cell wall biosynthesis
MNKDEELLSVVIPAYNAEKYIENSIRSVLLQSEEQFQLVIINDGSTDSTLEICNQLAEEDARIEIYSQLNAGAGSAMNFGISKSRGDWVIVMHADDIMLPNRLERIRSAANDSLEEIGIITAGVHLIGENGKYIGKAKPSLPMNPFFLNETNLDFIIGGLYHTAIRSRCLHEVGGYSADCRFNEDVELYNRIAESGFGIKILPEYLMEYRIHEDSASNSKARELMLHWRYLKQNIRLRRKGESIPTWNEFINTRLAVPIIERLNQWRKDLAKIEYRRAAGCLSGTKRLKAIYHAIISFTLQPSYIYNRWLTRR